ncbi:MAG TPA: ATP-binding protein [Tepidisphaeraceae bacterium]|nr:ATP-binding protein [Tepidisphaeraceae bacterium]
MDTQTQNLPTEPASSSNPPAPFRRTVLSPEEAAVVIAQRTAETRQARAAAPKGPEPLSAVLPLPERIERFQARMATEAAAPRQPDEFEAHQKRQAVEKLLAASGVPTRYVGGSLVKIPLFYEATTGSSGRTYGQAAAALYDLHDYPGIVALIGHRGTGKTWMSCAAVQDFCRRGQRAFYMNAFDYFIELKSTFDDGSRMTQAKVEEKYLRPKLLVLDEVHERGDTPWEDRTLTRIVNKRYEAELATVLVSNQTPEQFADRVGASIADRIHDGGGVIVCDWASLRGRVPA